jgi:aspartate/methionine/tyrosine aminotransferase
MSNILLAKPELPNDWRDVSVGEPHVVRDTLLKIFDLSVWELPQDVEHMFEYPSPIGYKPLVKLLEDKHQAPVIITNGAKQGLAAIFYALHKMKYERVGMRLPYWALIPPLSIMHGVESVVQDPYIKSDDPHLLLAPNNPDGFCHTSQELKELSDIYKDIGVPLIHDAAYYTKTYLPDGHVPVQVGDVQIYSLSKSLGLSGLRVGYVVCPNVEYYKLIQQYMEAMTVGVSIISQMLAEHMLHRMHGYPTLAESFESMSQAALTESKKIIKTVSSEVLEVPTNMETIPGMFGWFKVGPKADFAKSKVNFIDGALFGVPGMVRMNLAFNKETMEDIVKRLNGVLEE